MAEAVGLAASITALIEIAGSISKICLSYIESVKDYPKDLRRIYLETTYLESLFQSLRFLDDGDSDDSAAIDKLSQPDGPILECERVMKELSNLLTPSSGTTPSHGAKRQKLNITATSLAWPLKATRAKKLLDEITHHKSTITMTLTGELVHEVKSLKKDVLKVNQSLSESLHRKICDWFEQTNPSQNHNAAKSLYEDGTASWVLRSEEWLDWINLQSRALWLHGIPGAGKTVMMSYLVEETTRRVHRGSENKNDVCIYYYCYHGHNQDAAIPFLRWILSQMFRESGKISPSAQEVFNEGRDPDVSRLLDLLADSADLFNTVFVIIDAIDESQNRENILNLLQKIVYDPRLPRIQLLISSRDYHDIRRIMARISVPLSLSNPLVESDIKLFVSKRIATNEKFSWWPDELRAEVEEKLSIGAKGMFRWAVCQLDILRRLSRIDKIRTALQSLPETLDDTYEKIFSCIHPEERELVRHVLRWICFHDEIWDEPSIESSLLLGLYPLSIGEDRVAVNYLFSIDSLKDSCGCLVTFIDDDDDIEKSALAHYTVREFLESGRLKDVSLYFRLCPDIDYPNLFNAMMRHALTAMPQDETHDSESSTGRSRLYCLASTYRGLRRIVRVSSTLDIGLIYFFLNPTAPHFSVLQNAWGPKPANNEYLGNCVMDDEQALIWSWNWGSFDGPPMAGYFMILVNMELHDYAEHHLKVFGVKEVLEANICIESTSLCPRFTYHELESHGPHRFKGSVLEYFATYARRTEWNVTVFDDKPFKFCCKRGFGHVNLSNILPYYAVLHRDRCPCRKARGADKCFMKKLLAHGAQPNPQGFEVTPLQTCCFKCDVRGVQLLLEAGADANDTGQKGGYAWDSMFTPLTALHGHTPLRILRKMLNFKGNKYEMHYNRPHIYDMISLLKQYGAEDPYFNEGLDSDENLGFEHIDSAGTSDSDRDSDEYSDSDGDSDQNLYPEDQPLSDDDKDL